MSMVNDRKRAMNSSWAMTEVGRKPLVPNGRFKAFNFEGHVAV